MKATSHKRARVFGFTLIELMIVVVVIGILAAIAFPTYRDQVRKTRRTEAKAALQEAMNRQERLYTTTNRYTDDVTDLGYANDPFITDDGWYSVSAAQCGAGLADCVTLTAAARLDQGNDQCGDFTLDSRGQPGVTNQDAGVTAQDCW